MSMENSPNARNILLVTIEGGGNIPPMLGLARRLADRGHQVHILTEPCLERAAQQKGYIHHSFSEYFTRTDRAEDIMQDWNSKPTNNPTLEKVVFGPAPVVARETHRVAKQIGADLLLVDCLMPGALIAAEALGLPSVLAFHFPEYLPGPNRPPGLLGLKPGRGWVGRIRDRMLASLFHKSLDAFLPNLNTLREAYNLESFDHTADLFHRADLRWILTLKDFDFPLSPAPDNVRYTGPILDDPDWTDTWQNPFPASDDRPLVVVSLSSTFQNQQSTLQRIMDALRSLPVRGLVTLGPAMEEEYFEVPSNVVVVQSAPHSQMFPEADLVVTHAGHGTIMRALAYGLPLLCLPMGRDQPDNAVKVLHHGLGIKLRPSAKPRKIGRATQRLLADKAFRQNAQSFESRLINNTALDRCISEVELRMEGAGTKMV
jgi:MGT family glycosyltransferase